MAGSLSGTAVVHVDGYDLLRFPDLQTAADLALPAGMPVSVDAAAATGAREAPAPRGWALPPVISPPSVVPATCHPPAVGTGCSPTAAAKSGGPA
jgi:hypothetical protein